ncbi:MAG: ABC transporter permease, partial [Dehalococcoidales bacterium]
MIRAIIVAGLAVRTYLQESGDLGFSLLLPIAIFALMYGAFGGQDMFHGTAHVVNEDQGGTYSTLLLEQLDELDTLDVDLLSAPKADLLLERSDLLMVLFIPEDFSDRFASGEPTQLLFKQRGNGGSESQIVASIIRGVVEEMNQSFQVQSQVNSALSETGIPEERIDIAVQKYLALERSSPTVRVKEDTVGSSPDPVNQFLPGILTMFVLFAQTLNATVLVQERRLGTLERLLTTRLSVGQLFIGKFLAGLSRGFVQAFVLLVLAYIVFQLFTPLSFIECLVIILILSAAASALGLIIGSIARTEDQASWIAVVFTMTMVMLGGTFFEIPKNLEILSQISMNTYANNALKTVIAQGGHLVDLGLELGVLAGIIVVGLGLSRLIFKVMPGGR